MTRTRNPSLFFCLYANNILNNKTLRRDIMASKYKVYLTVEENGKKVRKQFYGKTKKDAEKKRDDYLLQQDKKEKKILTKSLKENKNFLHAVKKDFDEEIIKSVEKCLQYQFCGVLIE